MDNLIYNTIKRQQREIAVFRRAARVPRDQGAALVRALASPLIKVILGPRRAGKSTLALQALEGKRFAYVNFDDESLPDTLDGDVLLEALRAVYGSVEVFFFDEIQNVRQWELLLNRFLRLGLNLVVTGSNARLLDDTLATTLTGRYIVIELLPFSLREALQLPQTPPPDAAPRAGAPRRPARHPVLQNSIGAEHHASALQTYLQRGGFPEVVLGRVDYRSYLEALWDAITLKDIAARKRVRDVAALRSLLTLFLTAIGSRHSTESLTRALGGAVSAPTVKKFLAYGAEAYLIRELQPFFGKPRRRLKADRKAYVTDNGFFSARHAGLVDDHGRLLENMVFLELWRRGHRPNFDLFYYTTRQGHEVDFLVRDGYRNVELIQVAVSLGQQKTRLRELRALTEAAEELDVGALTILTLNESGRETIDGRRIRITPALPWFLGDAAS